VAEEKKGELEKLVIQAYTKPDYSGTPVEQFTAYFNPDEYIQVYDLEYEEKSGDGSTGSPMKFKRIKPQDYTLKFLLDGTGASGPVIEVSDKVKSFFSVVGFDGSIHRPRYLQVVWGTLRSRCVLLKAEISYKLFKPDGKPLRALVTASFRENIDDATRVKKENKSSPDLMHAKTVREGDAVPLLAYEYYGDPAFSPEIARVNGLDTFRRVTAGNRIVLPPLDKRAYGK
jgi:hypothetical protein